MELFIFGRFHAGEGREADLQAAVSEVVRLTRAEAGCLAIRAYRGLRDPRLFYIHSHWTGEADFEVHSGLPHTLRFIERAQTLIDHPLDIVRALPVQAGPPQAA